MKTTKKLAFAAAMALGFSGAMGSIATAQETINITAIDGYPARAMWVKEFSSFFIPRVNEKLAESGNYKLNWQEAYG